MESKYKVGDHPCFLVKEHDNIIFTTPQGEELFYSVQFNFLTNRKSLNNEVIFEELGIRDRYAFCSRAYGYQTIEGMFPVCKGGDYEALTRVILALGRYCREVSLNGNTIITNTVAQICRNRVQEFYNIESTASSTEEKKKLQLDFASPECILHINKKQYKF